MTFGGIAPPTSVHYKLAWFAGCGSSAPAHIRIFVSSKALVAHTFYSLHSRPRSSRIILYQLSLSSNMHSYKTLAVLALAISTASPAFSAPVVSRPAVTLTNVRAALPSGVGSDVGSLLKTIGTNLAFGALPVALEHFLGGNSTRLASLFDDLLTSLKSTDSIGTVIKNGLLGGVASGVGAVGASELLNNTRREPSPLSGSDFSAIAKTVAGALISLGAADGVKEAADKIFNRDDASPQDIMDVLQLLGSKLEELD
ncbi:hypothetical protein EDB83DRAFT_2382453 [Lactarius deliciosus]|nr:hypothetical protein EDB83DRAFT_2382453 [Lactarius deliciosus]